MSPDCLDDRGDFNGYVYKYVTLWNLNSKHRPVNSYHPEGGDFR